MRKQITATAVKRAERAEESGTSQTANEQALKGNGKGDNGSFEAEGDFDSLNQPVKEVDLTSRNDLVRDLILDSNKKFPMSEINANKMLDEFIPDGYKPRTVAGPGGEGADLVLEGPEGQIFKIENKSTQSFRGFDKEISHAAQNQASGNLVFVQVPEGTDASKWMARFWGNRAKAGMLDLSIPENATKMQIYKNTDIVIFDSKGNQLLPRQPIYNPPE